MLDSLRIALKNRQVLFVLLFALATSEKLYGEVIWIEGEKPVKAEVTRHPWWYDKVKKDQLSGGDFISNWGGKPGRLEYTATTTRAGDYDFWVRANPVGTKLSYRVNEGTETEIDLSKDQRENTNIAEDNAMDLRYLAWEHVGNVPLLKGENRIVFRMHSDNQNHGMLDCFVLSDEAFEPHGLLKPGEVAKVSQGDAGWVTFEPRQDDFAPSATLDLRFLNEKNAGDGGFIQAKNGEFVHSKTNTPVRFWAVNGPPDNVTDPQELRRCARLLAKHGVNLVRLHAPYFNADGEIEPARVQHAIDVVEAMKSEGIYTDFSVYWYSFFAPKPGTPWLQGYDGKTHPTAALIFNSDFQKKYEQWWTALLTTPSGSTGKRLIDEPACALLEIQNEDSLFFWTFSDKAIPDAQMRIIEKMFGDWLIKRNGSIDAAYKKWSEQKVDRDSPAEGRMGFRPLWNMFNERTARDKDTASFLTALQRDFYRKEVAFLHQAGFKGVVTTSGWTTASPEFFGPLDKYTNTAGDYIDRHGYFGGSRTGPNDGWALADTQIYSDRSALRFDPTSPGASKLFTNPIMDPHYGGKPSVISETSFDRPNRYRAEAPLYYACYGSLQDSSGLIFFALDTDHWSVKPNYFMQPWTLMSPACMGQFPAAAMIFRQKLITPGDVLVKLNLKIPDLENLQGTPMPQDASFDELRLRDVPTGTKLKSTSVIDPLVHFAGRTEITFSDSGAAPQLVDLKPLVDHAAQTVISSNHQLKLDYGKGTLLINAPQAQGISGNLKSAGAVETTNLSISCDLETGHIIAVALDGNPLSSSSKILLQVMSEERASGFKSEDVGNGKHRITDIGHDPWLIKSLSGSVKIKRDDANRLRVTPLDANGYPLKAVANATDIRLESGTIYYLISK